MRRVAAVLLLALLVPAAAQAAGFEVIGHRGSRGLRPENTIPAFTEAMRVGATALEADVVVTKDGHVVVSHELRVSGTLCRGPGVGRFFKNLTLAQVRRLDCGRRSDDAFESTQVPVPGAHVPTLDQVLRLVRPREGVRVLVELKRDATAPRETVGRRLLAERVVAMIRKTGMRRRVIVQSYDWGALRAVARLEPRLPLMGLANAFTVYPGSPWLGGIPVKEQPFRSGLGDAVRRAGFDAVSPHVSEVTPELVYGAHSRGLGVIPFTVNTPGRIRSLVELGVDGIVSDYPDRLRRTARRAGVPIAR